MDRSDRMIRAALANDGDPLEFSVVVQDGEGETRHAVTMARAVSDKLTSGHTSNLNF